MISRVLRLALMVSALAITQPVLGDAAKVFTANPAFPSTPAGVDERPQGEWLGQLAIGFNSTSGNTETSSLSSRLLLGYERRDWRHVVNLIGNRASDSSGTISERYQLTGKTDYKINADDYLFATAQGERDRFAGITLRTSQAVGYGRDLFKTEHHQINGEIGVGARQVRFTDDRRDSDAILRLAAGYLWQISDASEFSQRLVVEAGTESTYSESVTALKSNLIGSVYLNLTFTVKHNDRVPAERVKTDTFTAVQLEYRF